MFYIFCSEFFNYGSRLVKVYYLWRILTLFTRNSQPPHSISMPSPYPLHTIFTP
jgi:hypothetical protein